MFLMCAPTKTPASTSRACSTNRWQTIRQRPPTQEVIKLWAEKSLVFDTDQVIIVLCEGYEWSWTTTTINQDQLPFPPRTPDKNSRFLSKDVLFYFWIWSYLPSISSGMVCSMALWLDGSSIKSNMLGFKGHSNVEVHWKWRGFATVDPREGVSCSYFVFVR